MQKVQDLIIQAGGIKFIESKVSLNTFCDYVAFVIDCTPQKAREYVQTCKRGSMARAKIESLKPRVNDAETPSHDHKKRGNSNKMSGDPSTKC